MKTSKLTFSLLAAVILTLGCKNFAKAQDDNIYSLHAMFIHNFIKYTEWPNSGQAITVGVMDNSEATQVLSKKVSASSKAQVKNLRRIEEIDACQIIFVPSGSRSQLAKILERVKGKPTLVITEDPDMVRKGASISFKVIDEKMKFQMNQDAIRSSGLKVSSSLVALAVN